jgi:hypothetical protein
MSTITIKFDLPPETQAVIRNLSEAPEKLPVAIKRGMDRALSIVRGRVQANRFSGVGPFPPEWHRLGERSGGLRQSIVEEPAVIYGNEVTGAIGVGVFYGQVHEFGKQIYGKPLMTFQIPRGSRIYGTGGGVAGGGETWVRAKLVIIPPRAALTTGVTENLPFIAEEISQDITKSLSDK